MHEYSAEMRKNIKWLFVAKAEKQIGQLSSMII